MKSYFLALVIFLGLFGTTGHWGNWYVQGEAYIKMLEHGTNW
ncbi:hypothetical protein Elgi_26540 [Paenibacillus elgii]|nr:hypothetical protein Elgi_26540 [Paenibacillus elgii]